MAEHPAQTGSASSKREKKKQHPFRRAVLRGLGVVLPPLLTVVIFLWVGNTVREYVLTPIEAGTRYVMMWMIADTRDNDELPADADERENFAEIESGKYIPADIYHYVQEEDPRARRILDSYAPVFNAESYYKAYINARYLQPQFVIPVFIVTFLAAMYLIGNFIAAGIGHVSWNMFERGVLTLPLIRNVYGSVKQVTDFMFTEKELEFNRVVAIEYPRKGIWSVGFVTGESFQDIHAAANEPVLSILVPTSPAPVTGYTINCRKSEVLDLDMTIDQAFQFTISCGVVVPPHQLPLLTRRAAQIDVANGNKSDDGSPAALPSE